MFEQESKLFASMINYLKAVVADISDANLTKAVPGAVNPPAYILGHLAICNDFTLKLLGQPPVCPPEWSEPFAPGNNPAKMKIEYPSKEELMGMIQKGHEHISAAVKKASPEAMSQPKTLASLAASTLTNVGDLVALLMTTHFALHVGQLSLMRRQLGNAPLF